MIKNCTVLNLRVIARFVTVKSKLKKILKWFYKINKITETVYVKQSMYSCKKYST